MEFKDIYSIICNVGFPVVACIYLAKQNDRWATIGTQITETLKAMEIRLQEVEKRLEFVTKKGDDDNDN